MKAQTNDYIRHPDDKMLYRVEGSIGGVYVLDDGRYLGDDELAGEDVLLESEGYDEFYRQVR